MWDNWYFKRSWHTKYFPFLPTMEIKENHYFPGLHFSNCFLMWLGCFCFYSSDGSQNDIPETAQIVQFNKFTPWKHHHNQDNEHIPETQNCPVSLPNGSLQPLPFLPCFPWATTDLLSLSVSSHFLEFYTILEFYRQLYSVDALCLTFFTSSDFEVPPCSPVYQQFIPFYSGVPWSLGTSLVVQMVKRLPEIQKTRVQSLGQEGPLEKEMATHSSTLAWKIPWTEEHGRLQSMGLQRVRHGWATSLSFAFHGVHVPWPVYSFRCWWMFEKFCHFNYSKQSYYEHSSINFSEAQVFPSSFC